MKSYNNYNNFKITDEKWDDFYQSLMQMNDSESIQQSKDILYSIKKKNNFIKRLEYDFILKTIKSNGENDVDTNLLNFGVQSTKKWGEEKKYAGLVYPKYWVKSFNTSKNIQERKYLFNILNNITNRKMVIDNGVEKYPATQRELNVLSLFDSGNLSPEAYSTKN